MESLVRTEVFVIIFTGALFQASVSSPGHCTVRAKPQGDAKPIKDAYDKWVKETFMSPHIDKELTKPCGVSALEMEAKELSLQIMEIRGGHEAPPGKWPWHVLVYSTLEPATCGGTLISRLWVVTAAHCLALHTMNRVVTGVHKRSDIDRGQIRVISRSFSHWHFHLTQFSKDIALLKLAEPLFLSNSTWPVCLPSQSETFGQGEECYTTGFGGTGSHLESNVLKELEVRIMERSECEEIFFRDPEVNVDESMFCSKRGGTASTRHDGICAGDVGGPLVCRKNHQWTLVGISSSSMGCWNKTSPDLFTNVSHFRHWIDNRTLIKW